MSFFNEYQITLHISVLPGNNYVMVLSWTVLCSAARCAALCSLLRGPCVASVSCAQCNSTVWGPRPGIIHQDICWTYILGPHHGAGWRRGRETSRLSATSDVGYSSEKMIKVEAFPNRKPVVTMSKRKGNFQPSRRGRGHGEVHTLRASLKVAR